MTPIEAAIQAATNAGSAHGFAQALDNVAHNVEIGIAALDENLKLLSEQASMREIWETRKATLSEVLQQVAPQRDSAKAQAASLEQTAKQAAALAYQSVPDMGKVRGAIAVILGAG